MQDGMPMMILAAGFGMQLRPVSSGARLSDDSERRETKNGLCYTLSEFTKYYGRILGLKEWKKAPAAGAARAAVAEAEAKSN